MKNRNPGFVAVSVFILGLCLLASCTQNQAPPATEAIANTSTTSPFTTVTPTTTNAPTQEQLHLETTTEWTPLTPDYAHTSTFEDKEYGYSFQYPASWTNELALVAEYNKKLGPQGIADLKPPQTGTSARQLEMVVISVEGVRSLTEALNAIFKKEYSTPLGDYDEEEIALRDGSQAYRGHAVWKSYKGGESQGYCLGIKRGDTVIVWKLVYWQADDKDIAEQLTSDLLATIKILETNPPIPAVSSLFQKVDIPGFTTLVEGTNGLACVDINRDGLMDIVATYLSKERKMHSLRIFLNNGGLNFTIHPFQIFNSDGSAGEIIRNPQIPNLIDFNKDGFLDIFITANGGSIGNQLLISDGAWDKFTDMSDRMRIRNEEGYNRQSSIADVNEDGWLDIAIGCDNIADGRFGLSYSRLYIFKPNGSNFADGHFEDIGGTDLVPGFGGFYSDPDKDRAGPGIILRDLDDDGDLDLVQGYHMDTWGQFNVPNACAHYYYGIYCWKNRLSETGEFRFEPVWDNGLAQRGKLDITGKWQYTIREKAVALPFISMADINNDGRLDVVGVGPCTPNFLAAWSTGIAGQLWQNKGGFQFKEITNKAGLSSLNWTNRQWFQFWGEMGTAVLEEKLTTAGKNYLTQKIYGGTAVFGDFNNDGWVDLLVTDRHLTRPQSLNRNMLYLNNGDGTFRLLSSEESGIFDNSLFAEAADLNNDGLLDIIFARDPGNNGVVAMEDYTGPEKPDDYFRDIVYINNGQFGGKDNHWLKLRFSGVTDAELAGARVMVYPAGTMDETDATLLGMRVVFSNQHHKSGTPLQVHFGLGTENEVDIKVILNSGKTVAVKGITANQTVEIDLSRGS